MAGGLYAFTVKAQPSMTLNGPASFTILAGTSVSMNGLVLTPAVDFSVTGPNQFNQNTTLTHAVSGIHISRVYKWTNLLNTFQGEVGFYYNDAELNGLQETSLILQLYDGNRWNPFTTVLSRNTGTNLVRTAVNGYALDEFTLTDALTILPLVWGPVTASRVQEKVYIKWKAYGAETGDHFGVERSMNSADWYPVAAPVQASAGEKNYVLEDKDAPHSKTFYRIRLVPANGDPGTLSRMAMIPAIQAANITVYPNPVKDMVTVQCSMTGVRQLKLYSAAGMLVQSALPGNVSFYSINTASLAPGHYLLQLTLSDNTISSFPLIKK